MDKQKHIVPISQKVVVVNRNGKLLALLRSPTAPSNPLRWDLPGGDLEWGEDPMQSAQREVEEETGIALKKLQLFDIESHITSRGVYWTTVAYIAKAPNDEVSLSFEHDKYQWLTKTEFLDLDMSNKIRRFITNYSPK